MRPLIAQGGFSTAPAARAGLCGTAGAIPSKAIAVKEEDRVRIKAYASVGTGQDFQTKLVVRFIRANDVTCSIVEAVKILTFGNDRGTTFSGTGASFPLGDRGGYGRTVSDCNTTASSGTVTCTSGAFASTDIGKAITITGAATACSSAPCQGPSFPSTLYQGVITAVGSGTSVTVFPNAMATQSSNTAVMVIEPRLLATDGREMGDGWIIDADMNYWQLNSRRGQAFFEVEVNRPTPAELGISNNYGHNIHHGSTFMRGYLGTSSHLVMGQDEYQLEGQGYATSVACTDPAAGVEVVCTVPANARWKVKAFRFALVTDGTVASRFVNVRVKDASGNILWDAGANVAQTASLTTIYNVAPGVQQQAAIVNLRLQIPIPPDLVLFQGYTIETFTTALVAGDNHAVPFLLVEEWIED